MIKEVLKTNKDKNLFLLHTVGSHYPLNKRYPAQFNVFNISDKKYINEYNNSIYYTDYVIEGIIKEIETTPSILIYVSDHAQIDNGSEFVHSFTKKGLEVPFFIWHSDSVDEKFKITDRLEGPISTTELYEIIKKYLGVTTEIIKDSNSELKVISGDFKVNYYDNLNDGQEVHAGEELLIKIDFTDNIGLASYKIDIHYSDDGHVHRTTDTTTNELWAYEFSEPISGKNITKELSIEVPQNTEGTYHFGVFAIDTSGNQNLVWQSIHIHND